MPCICRFSINNSIVSLSVLQRIKIDGSIRIDVSSKIRVITLIFCFNKLIFDILILKEHRQENFHDDGLIVSWRLLENGTPVSSYLDPKLTSEYRRIELDTYQYTEFNLNPGCREVVVIVGGETEVNNYLYSKSVWQ